MASGEGNSLLENIKSSNTSALRPVPAIVGNRDVTASFLPTRILVVLAIAIVFATLCFRLGYFPLLAPDEGRNAEVAREMNQSGAWLVPTYNGVDYLDKPAFYFKAVAVCLGIFGNNETAARMASASFGVALTALVFAFGRKVQGARLGSIAMIIVASMPLFLANARTVIFDIALAFFVCAAIFAGYLAEEAEGKTRRNWYLLGAAASGFATLVKGPVGFLIPMLVLLVFNRIEGRRGIWKRLFSPLNLLVFFAITLPWFIGLCLAHRDFFYYGLVEESFHRFTTAKKFHRSEPFYFYLFIVAVTFVPWSFLLPEAAVAMWRERWAKQRVDRLCLVWSILVVVFFSLSQSKLPGYILSVTVSCGILLARVFDTALSTAGGRAARLVGRATIAFAVVCLIFGTLIMLGGARAGALAKPLHIPASDAERLGNFVWPLAIVFLGFGAFGLIARHRRSATLCFLCFALFSPLLIHVAAGAGNVIFDAKSGRRIAQKLSAVPPGMELACLECFPNGLPFYLTRTMTLISRNGGELTSNYILFNLEKNPQWPKQIVPLSEFDNWLASRKNPVYLIVRRADQSKLTAIADSRNARVEQLSPEYFGASLPVVSGN